MQVKMPLVSHGLLKERCSFLDANHRLHGQFLALSNGGRPVGARVDDPVNTPAYLTAELRRTMHEFIQQRFPVERQLGDLRRQHLRHVVLFLFFLFQSAPDPELHLAESSHEGSVRA